MADGGGFGSVQRGSYHGQTCAVKIYKNSVDPSYERERQMVTSGRLIHENIARYWAADTKDGKWLCVCVCLHMPVHVCLRVTYLGKSTT